VPAPTLVVWDEALAAYDFGSSHPLAPVRVELTMALARELGVLDPPLVQLDKPEPADDGLLELVHSRDYVAAVRRAGDDPAGRPDLEHGLGTSDNPVFPGMHEASALVVGASVAAARAVWEGRAGHAVNVAGGLHHAMPSAASGFCVYNDPAIAIAWLLENGARRVGYVDVDVHHGDGVQAAFYGDPRVLTISLHETGRMLFPGTGFADETGGPGAEGTSVNVALPAGTGDAGWLRAFDGVVPPLLRAFAPDVLVSQSGCDTHALDPLAHLMLSVDGQRLSYGRLHGLAHEVCDGRWVVLGGGGYELVHVVPRAWTHLLAEAAHRPLDPAVPVPEGWRELARRRANEPAPVRMTDGRSVDYVPWGRPTGEVPEPLDRAVQATRRAVFAAHGLDPEAAA
jgi:acetoin utilization protein AcuC